MAGPLSITDLLEKQRKEKEEAAKVRASPLAAPAEAELSLPQRASRSSCRRLTAALLDSVQPKFLTKAERAALALEKRQKETLTDQNQDEEWTGPISIGSNKQQFTIDFDTGSSDLWVPNSKCTSSVCRGKHTYKSTSSSTSKSQKGTFQIQYGDGSTVSGPVYQDTVTVAGVTAKNQYFSPVTTLSDSFSNDPIDGILGLAYPTISNLNTVCLCPPARHHPLHSLTYLIPPGPLLQLRH